jgi:exopolysaccharide biosynthesis predicted pyruvyltransferase EpsI
MKRKIAILTQPLHDNYGGLLQAYALSTVLKKYGDVTIANRWYGHDSALFRLISKIKNQLFDPKPKLSIQQKKLISQHTFAFREKYIPNLSHRLTTQKQMKDFANQGFDTYVVGSDQCWRPRYSPCIENYFLDFVPEKKEITRISYAASFGTSDWEFNGKQSKTCKNLIQKFDAVSVREDSGVDLCSKFFDSEAIHLIDPTMLLNINDYNTITNKENQKRSNGDLKVYILDKTDEKKGIVDFIALKTGLSPFEVMPKKRIKTDKIDIIENFIYPSPIAWLQGYQDASFVIADSFHGTVFSILYNIPFIAVGNKGRGMARFESLLRMFGLENRLLTNFTKEDAQNILDNDIDWLRVNNILEKEKAKAFEFLNTYLN